MLSDNPIKTEHEDLLRRVPLAKKIASLISQYTEHESFVIGIDGPWGSGKTSFVNLINEQLQTDETILLIEFNPWNFSDQNELIKEFFSGLLVHLNKYVKNKKVATNKVLEYAGRLTKGIELSVEPEISFMGLIKLKVGKMRKAIGDKALEGYRKSVDDLIKETGKKVVICIDDTDRLDVEETKLVLKLVKMTANFYNTIFLLSYDRSKVSEKITEKGFPGDEYLQKIVQVNFRLPVPEQQDLYRILSHDINSIIEDIEGERWETNRWRGLFHSGFKDFFKTIRDIKRYVSSLSLDLSIVGKFEVNPVDFIGVELIRVFAPDIYAFIGDNKELFTGRESFWQAKNHDARKNTVDEKLDGYPNDELKESLKKVVRELFPQLRGGSISDEFRKELRVCVPEMFGRYFQMSTPSGTVSEETIRSFMTTSFRIEELTQNLKDFQRDGKLRNVLTRALDYLDSLDEEQKGILLTTLLSFGDSVKSERLEMFDMEDEDNLILRLIYHILKSLPPEKRGNLLKKTTEDAKSVYTGAHIVAILIDEKEKFQNKQSINEPIVNEEDLTVLKALLVQLIKKADSDNKLLESKRLPFILYRWKDWGTSEEVNSFIKKCIENKKTLPLFLKAFVSRVLSTSGDYNTLGKKSLGELYNISEIEDKVSDITDTEMASMSDSEQEAVQLFRNPPTDY